MVPDLTLSANRATNRSVAAPAAPAVAVAGPSAPVPSAPVPSAAVPSSPIPSSAAERFRDPQTGAIDVEALLQAYEALEQRMADADAAATAAADATDLLDPAAAVPDSPDGYAVVIDHGLFAVDPEVNARLHAAGCTPAQVQVVYDLAAERMLPVLQDLMADLEAQRDLDRLIDHFGGETQWREAARQIRDWAHKALPASVVETLSTSSDGVLALHRMMAGDLAASGGGGTGGAGEPAAGGTDEADLRRMMRDPRYWRERDPGFIARVTEGFRRLYPQG